MRRALIDASHVVLGETCDTSRYIKLGIDAEGRHVSLGARTAQLVLILGAMCYGKSHVLRLIGEAASLDLPGLSETGGPQRAIHVEADIHGGQTRRQMLCGYQPTPTATSSSTLIS